jgi:hypothetical protein
MRRGREPTVFDEPELSFRNLFVLPYLWSQFDNVSSALGVMSGPEINLC